MPHLQKLTIRCRPVVSQEIFKAIAQIRSLKMLVLSYSCPGEDGLEVLSSSQIETLWISYCCFTPEQFESLQRFPRLKNVQLTALELPEDWADRLTKCPALEKGGYRWSWERSPGLEKGYRVAVIGVPRDRLTPYIERP
jgi:hypothetical protein